MKYYQILIYEKTNCWQQDKAAKRLTSKANFITMDWLKQCLGTNCKSGVEFIYEYTKGNITSNLTVDRIDNDEHHSLRNIEPLCVLCSTSKSNTQLFILWFFFSEY